MPRRVLKTLAPATLVNPAHRNAPATRRVTHPNPAIPPCPPPRDWPQAPLNHLSLLNFENFSPYSSSIFLRPSRCHCFSRFPVTPREHRCSRKQCGSCCSSRCHFFHHFPLTPRNPDLTTSLSTPSRPSRCHCIQLFLVTPR